ncbi:MAG: SDR family NAD(P)-dependent oxidoreductase [Pikeienuella sp.]
MKTCLVTGGARGIGRATALLAAKNGYRVGVAGLAAHLAEAEAVAEEITRGGGAAIALAADVGREADIVAMFAKTKDALGPVDAVVNAAGMSYGAAPESYEAEPLNMMIRVNGTGLILCCREAIRQMDGRGGAIVNISSMAATIGGRPGAAAYAASKAAVDSYTTGAARDVAKRGIRINTIRPGVIATAMTEALQNNPEALKRIEESIPMGRIGQPEEIAAIAVWLMSEDGVLVNGAHINAGGGGFHVAAAV